MGAAAVPSVRVLLGLEAGSVTWYSRGSEPITCGASKKAK